MLDSAAESGRGEIDVEVSTSERDRKSVVKTPLFRLGRALFGGILAFMAIDNFRNLDERIGYAEAKGVPFPNVSVPAGSANLLLGGVGIALWRMPATAAAAVASFFLTTTPLMHDFWAVDDPEQQQQETFQFLKNAALLGAALAFLRVGRREEAAKRRS
ncbi:DoxX family membrane protein [Halostella sp. JP-L12]|uniref:DoxX family membrane protein n=1 Tax=Halostella TaxID=1843185 RepID=UPI000EF7C2A3|nr:MULTISPECIES: DoxX family membrane protein [Halostella]NHN45999.1 DoxX family membrane protein [Halostella sp. JP-L12]